MILVRGFALRGAIELQDGVDTDFLDSLGDGGLLSAHGEFALVFMAAEFALDGHISDPNSPAWRGMDTLPVEIRDGQIWVKFQNFRAGRAEKIPVA